MELPQIVNAERLSNAKAYIVFEAGGFLYENAVSIHSDLPMFNCAVALKNHAEIQKCTRYRLFVFEDEEWKLYEEKV